MTALKNETTSHGVRVSEVVAGGLTLTHTAAVDDVSNGLSVLPSVSSPMLTYRGVANTQEGNSWTLSFSSNEGAMAELVCITDVGFVGNCEVGNDDIMWSSRHRRLLTIDL